MAYLSNFDDMIDSRDVIDRIEELQGETELEFREELDSLESLQAEASPANDWPGGYLVRDSYFMDHTRELAEDIGIQADQQWPYRHIDWYAAAEELKEDYFSVDFDGVTYWINA